MQISQESILVGVFYNKVSGPQNCNFIKKRLQNRCFSVKFAKFLITSFFTEHLQWLLLTVSGFQPATSLKKSSAKMFSCEFCKIFKSIFWQNTHISLLFVFICEFWEVFRTSLLQSTSGKLLISCTSCRISTSR